MRDGRRQTAGSCITPANCGTGSFPHQHSARCTSPSQGSVPRRAVPCRASLAAQPRRRPTSRRRFSPSRLIYCSLNRGERVTVIVYAKRDLRLTPHGRRRGDFDMAPCRRRTASVSLALVRCATHYSASVGLLSCPVLCPVLSGPALPCPAFHCPALPCIVVPYPTLPFCALPCRALPFPTLSCIGVPCPHLPCAMSCPVLPCPFPSAGSVRARTGGVRGQGARRFEAGWLEGRGRRAGRRCYSYDRASEGVADPRRLPAALYRAVFGRTTRPPTAGPTRVANLSVRPATARSGPASLADLSPRQSPSSGRCGGLARRPRIHEQKNSKVSNG